MLKKFIIPFLLLVGLFSIWPAYFIAVHGFGIGNKWLEKRDWNKVKNNPYVQAIGHWDEGKANTEIEIGNEIIPLNISRDEWQKLMSDNGFYVQDTPEQCDLFEYNPELFFLKNYHTCASKSVGEYRMHTCNYWYIVMGYFEEGQLRKSAGTRMIIMC